MLKDIFERDSISKDEHTWPPNRPDMDGGVPNQAGLGGMGSSLGVSTGPSGGVGGSGGGSGGAGNSGGSRRNSWFKVPKFIGSSSSGTSGGGGSG